MGNKIEIQTKKVKFQTAPELYGLFFEDINHAADGGLYPEMIRNRAFEDSLVPEGCTTDEKERIFVTEYGWPGAFWHGEGMDEWAARVAPTKIPGWYAENAVFTLRTQDTLNANRKAALSVCFEENGKIYNIGYCGIPIKEGEGAHFYTMLKTEQDNCLQISLESKEGAVYASETIRIHASESYARYDCDLLAKGTDFEGRICIQAAAKAEISFGFTSLMPHKTFKGHGLREDLALALKNTHSKFIRFPGGCVVEGINEQNSLRFSRTIGPVWERPSCMLMWHYRTTNGLGFHEYLQLCEDLEMEALYVCNCGMSCQARHGGGFSKEVTDEYLTEALHALEYALGDESTEYGALRAKYGHKEPFRLKYVEIGNENWGPEYLERYRLFYETLKRSYPQVIYISNAHTEREGLPTEIADEHYYNAPEFFLENGDLFDGYDRKGPEIFVGEYAVNGGNTIASMECALAEAAFLLGIENNQDIVKLTAYAPLFQNSDYTAWKPNMIVFNNHQVYGIPSYHAVSLLAKYRGSEVVEVSSECVKKPPVFSGISGIQCEKEGLIFKNVKINQKDAPLTDCVYGEVRDVPEGFMLVQSEKTHHYTGKCAEYNEAFETFVNGGRSWDKPVLWATFGEEELTEYTFEADVKADADNAIIFTVWNHHIDTDVGCNEPKDTEWNLRSVRNQIWKLENGVSTLRIPGLFDKALSAEETAPCPVLDGAFHHYRIVCDREGYACYMDGALIQEKKLTLHPVVHSVATQDENRVYVKLVNVDDNDQEIRIALDCAVKDQVLEERLSAAMDAVNSFENGEAVSSVTNVLTGGRNFDYQMPAHSVSVLIFEKEGCL